MRPRCLQPAERWLILVSDRRVRLAVQKKPTQLSDTNFLASVARADHVAGIAGKLPGLLIKEALASEIKQACESNEWL